MTIVINQPPVQATPANPSRTGKPCFQYGLRLEIVGNGLFHHFYAHTFPHLNQSAKLEKKAMTLLGYKSNLVGGYPDVPNQLLEVKVQDSPTIELGKYSPEFEEVIYSNITTEDIRYLIALTNPKTNVVESVILVSGKELCDIFSFVSDTSFKCQRSIPMSFFEEYKKKCVFNP